MHELSLMQDMIEAIEDRLRDSGDARSVKRVVLEVGRLSGVLPDALRFSFETCAAGSRVEAASLEIRETLGVARCRACGVSLRPETLYEPCECGSLDLEWLSGRELRIRELEVA